MNVAVLLSVLTSARSRGSHADVAEWKSHSATMHTKTMITAFVVRILLLRVAWLAGPASLVATTLQVWGENERTIIEQLTR